MQPNFLIFMTDQQRGDMQPTFGKAKMPNLERLAEMEWCFEGRTVHRPTAVQAERLFSPGCIRPSTGCGTM